MSEEKDHIENVSMGEYCIVKSGNNNPKGNCSNSNKLKIVGLGSCVGVAIFEPPKNLMGLAHVMLPKQQGNGEKDKKAKYADKAIDMLIDEMDELSNYTSKKVAKIAGGANMFKVFQDGEKETIGQRNIKAVKKHLKDRGVEILGEHTGGGRGRTIIADPKNQEIIVQSVSGKEKVL